MIRASLDCLIVILFPSASFAWNFTSRRPVGLPKTVETKQFEFFLFVTWFGCIVELVDSWNLIKPRFLSRHLVESWFLAFLVSQFREKRKIVALRGVNWKWASTFRSDRNFFQAFVLVNYVAARDLRKVGRWRERNSNKARGALKSANGLEGNSAFRLFLYASKAKKRRKKAQTSSGFAGFRFRVKNIKKRFR